MLVDHSDSQSKRIPRRTDCHRCAVDADFPVVREINARKHIHQRRLTAPIFTKERQYLSVFQLQVNILVGNDLSKCFGDMMHFHSIFCSLAQVFTLLLLFLSFFSSFSVSCSGTPQYTSLQ